MHKIHKNDGFGISDHLNHPYASRVSHASVFHDIALLLGLGLGSEAPRSGAERHQASVASRHS